MAEMPTDTVGHPVPDPVSVPQACRGHGPSGMLGRGDGAGGAVHTGVQEGERGWGLLAAQSSGGVGHGAEPMFGGDPRQGRPQPDVTCVELGAVDRSHHRVQLPACGQGEPVRPGAPSLWCSPHPPAGLQGATAPIPGQLQGVGCLGGGCTPTLGRERPLSHLPKGAEGFCCRSSAAAWQRGSTGAQGCPCPQQLQLSSCWPLPLV